MAGESTKERWVNCGGFTVGSYDVDNVISYEENTSAEELMSAAEEEMDGAKHAQTHTILSRVTIQTYDITAALAIKTAYLKTGLATTLAGKVYAGKNAGSAADKTIAVGAGGFLVTGVSGIGAAKNQYGIPTITGLILDDQLSYT